MDRAPGPLDLDEVRRRVDQAVAAELERARNDVAPSGRPVEMIDELGRLVGAGGKRVRPVLCVLGHLAAGGRLEDALPAAAALELFHTFALVHDDVMDDADERRGVAATHRWFAKEEPGGEAFGRSAAILIGDLAFALAVDLMASAPVPPVRVLAALRRFRWMSLATAAGQYLDLLGEGDRTVVAGLKTGVYTAEAPLAIGAELAGARPEVLEALSAFAGPLGVAFQLLDDVADGAASPDARRDAERLLDRASAALVGAPLEPRAAEALAEVGRRVAEGR